MRLPLFLVPLFAAFAAPAAAAGDPVTGLDALRAYNLIVIEDMTANHDVEGKTLVGGNLDGSSATFGIGNAADGQSAAPSAAPTLVVGGNNTQTNTNINNGRNGAAGRVNDGASVWVGGNSTANLNMNGSPREIVVGGNLSGNPTVSSGDTLKVGGNVGGVLSVNAGGSATLGGTPGGVNNNTSGNTNGTYLPGQGAAFRNGIVTQVTDMTTAVTADVKALSQALAGLTVIDLGTVTSNGNTLFLNAVDGGAGFALFNIDAALLATKTQIDYVFPSSTLPVIVNVSGLDITFDLNMVGGANASANQQIIWNFYEATELHILRKFQGSVLAPEAVLRNYTPIEGSVVARRFVQGGEVHLGTYNAGGSFLTPPPAVPEPATWATMIAGLGIVGGVLRRRGGAARRRPRGMAGR